MLVTALGDGFCLLRLGEKKTLYLQFYLKRWEQKQNEFLLSLMYKVQQVFDVHE